MERSRISIGYGHTFFFAVEKQPYLTAYEEHDAAALSDEEGDFFTWPEGSGGTEAEAAAGAEQAGVAPGLPPFLGRRPAAGAGGVDRTGDDRRETVAA